MVIAGRILTFLSLGAVLALVGCMTPQDRVRFQLRHLAKAVEEIRKEANSTDPTVKLFLVFAPDSPPNQALAALNAPESLYLATFRFITIVVRDDKTILYHKGVSHTYALPPGNWYFGVPSGKEALLQHFTSKRWAFDEVVVVADLQLNPIQSEQPGWPQRSPGYPNVLKKYGTFTQEEYEQWIKTKPSPIPD